MDQCLALRQQLKETFRAQLRKQSGGAAILADKENAPPADYGCFFGRSEIVFPDRAVEQLMILSAENPKFIEKVIRKKLIKNVCNNNPTDKGRKAEWLKNSRDYSFLSSNCDPPIPVPTNTNGVKSSSTEKDFKKAKKSRDFELQMLKEMQSTQRKSMDPRKQTKPVTKQISRPAEKKPLQQSQTHPRHEKFSRPARKKSLQQSQTHPIHEKFSRPAEKKPLKQEKKSVDSSGKPKLVMSKQLHQKNTCSESDGRKRKLEKDDTEKKEKEINVTTIIRELFGYDPTKFSSDDEDDLKMESTFDDIQKEERQSAKIAKKEDDEEELRNKMQQNSKKQRSH